MIRRYRLLFAFAALLLAAPSAFGQGVVMPIPHPTFFTPTGTPCANCTLETYAAGTSTPLATYSDKELSTTNGTEITLNSAGRPDVGGSEVAIYLTPATYKFVLKSAAGATLWTRDHVSATNFFSTILWVNDSANAKMTRGVTINQGSADDEILTLKSSDVGHGATVDTEADTFASIIKGNAAGGGAFFSGYSETATAAVLQGVADLTDTTRSTSAVAPVQLRAATPDTGAAATLAGNTNLVVITNFGTTQFIFDADGDSHQNVGTAWTNFDSHNDVSVLNALAVEVARADDPYKDQIRARFGDDIDALASREELERIGLVTFNDDGNHFVNMSKLTMLNVGAIRQVGDRQREQESRLALVERQAIEIAELRAELASLRRVVAYIEAQAAGETFRLAGAAR